VETKRNHAGYFVIAAFLGLLSACVCLGDNGPVPIDPNMPLWDQFDEPNGFVAHDWSGYDNHGQVNGPQEGWDPNGGRFGGCRIFDADTSIAVPNDVLSNINDGITVIVWLKDAYRPDTDNWVFEAGTGDYRLRVAVVTQPEKRVYWRAGNDTNDVLQWDLKGLDLNELEDRHLWAFVKDEQLGTMRIYFDPRLFGVRSAAEDTLSPCAAASKSGVDKTLAHIQNGPFELGALVSHTHYFVGKMDDFIIYDCAFPDAWFCPWNYGQAWGPRPCDGLQEVEIDEVLMWKGGGWAVRHDVYLGTDFDSVSDANTSSDVYAGRYDVNSYEAPDNFEFGETYFWRIDEVNEPNVWKGRVWSFTTANYITVDDFESYQDLYDLLTKWQDGIENAPFNGAVIDLGKPPDPIHAGEQSLLYAYFNDLWPYYSEAMRALDPAEHDWTEQGVKVLSMFFHGDPGNDANQTEQMYAGVEDACMHYAQIEYGRYYEDMNDIRVAEWHDWNMILADFAPVDFNNVTKLYIGFGDRANPSTGGSGVVFFDDIRLYPPRCVPGPWLPDLNDDCVVDYEDLQIMCLNWLKTGDLPGQFVGNDAIDFRDYARFADYWLHDQRWP